MARKSTSGLSAVTLRELHKELGRRQRQAGGLQRKRENLMRKVAAIDARIRDLGGTAVAGKGGRVQNATNLKSALHSLLEGKSMGVMEALAKVQEAGYVTHSPNFRTIVNQALLNKKLFKRTGRGVYTSI